MSKNNRVGIDIEIPVEKIGRIMHKFLSAKEHGIFELLPGVSNESALNIFEEPTLLWSAKESVFKWYANGGVDFHREIQLLKKDESTETIDCLFTKNNTELTVHYRKFQHLVLAWVLS